MSSLPRHTFTKFCQINDYAAPFIIKAVKFTPGIKTHRLRNPLVNILARRVSIKFPNVFNNR